MKQWKKEDIRLLRTKHNISQAKLAVMLGVTRNYVYLLEKGVKNASKTLKLLLECIEEKLSAKPKKKGR